ncbi:two-component system sensor histidine kinase TrcS [Mycobacterium sp. BK086]|uniref:sensor histidine kinase n=1 Tax=Mycobacterium sp. BK086 TaxID=2512165 RepID=UPI0010EED39A|nr:ATP-binding protein [Mycobacterium sp. BK086]TDO14182.1 two-component system sensor histidine kinase TrcS [Mycobacterium sp. BK086]
MAPRATQWWRPRTVSRQLMIGVSSLVSVVVLLVGALSIYTLREYVAAASNSEVMHSLAALKHSFAEAPAGDPAGRQLIKFTGQSAGTVIAVMNGGRVVQAATFDDAGARPAPAEAVTALETIRWTGDAPQSVDFGDLGRYRVAATESGDGQRLVSAISLRSASDAIAKKTAAVAAITLLAAIAAAVGTVTLVRRALHPLRRVAATAAKAARIPLADDEHRITARVRHADTDPDNEVGIVGETLNRLLANVDSVLAARAEADRRMRRFLTDVSHELRTPLATIQGYAELTRQDSASLPETSEYALARIESEARRMSALVDDMLLLSRLDEGQGLELERLDLCALVADAVNDIAVTAPDHRFLAELPADPVWIQGDRARLHQAVGNLLTNARIHTPDGVTVTTSIRQAADAVELTVLDDGPGIDPELLPDLFGRFVRADRARSRELNSSGLGLAIVASIVRAHGGTVEVESRPAHTEFRVRLPSGFVKDIDRVGHR